MTVRPRGAAAVALAIAVALGACGGGGAKAASTTTRPTTTTTTEAVSPEDAFRREVASTLDGEDATDVEAFLDLAKSACSTLDTARGVLTDDAAADTPETDASVVAYLDSTAIDLAFTGDTPKDVMAAVLRIAGRDLCPDNGEVIYDELRKRGL